MEKEPQELLSSDEVAARLRLSPETVTAWAAAGRIPSLKLSEKTRRYDWPAVLAALRTRGNSTTGTTTKIENGGCK